MDDAGLTAALDRAERALERIERALTSRELHLEAPWRRFVVHSPRQLPAPVESREPRPAER